MAMVSGVHVALFFFGASNARAHRPQVSWISLVRPAWTSLSLGDRHSEDPAPTCQIGQGWLVLLLVSNG